LIGALVRRGAVVRLDYHLELNGSFFSVPSTLIGQRVELRSTSTLLEIFHRGARIASHILAATSPGSLHTDPSHQPVAHRTEHSSPEQTVEWSRQHGPHLTEVIERTIAKFQRPEDSERACRGLRRLAAIYSPERLENACRITLRAAPAATPHRRDLESLLRRSIDLNHSLTLPASPLASTTHENIRGPEYYDKKECLN
jgi:hypothetical protein